jgi:CubicO group peptidase (beta-lactamase class C family)
LIPKSYIAARPEDAGVDSEALEALFARVKRYVDEGFLPSAQVAVARNGMVAGLRTFGTAVQGGVERPATDETLYCIFSCTKAVVACAVWRLLEDDLLRLEERVAEIIPEFGTNGKEVVTVEQVLLHTGGFPYAPFRPEYWGDRERLLEAFSRWRLNWAPGTRFEYHSTSAHWVLAEIIYRRTGKDFREFIREQVTGPMGLPELFVGLPEEYDGRVAAVQWVGEVTPPPGGWGEVTPETILIFNEPVGRRSGVPGGGGMTGAGELAMFYQVLINGGRAPNGRQVTKPETIEFATRVRNRFPDPVFGVPANRGLSIVVAGDDGMAHLRGFGKVAGPRAFGHGGAGGQIAWGDPDSGISVGFCTNGFNDWMTVARRTTAISSLAAACAGALQGPTAAGEATA